MKLRVIRLNYIIQLVISCVLLLASGSKASIPELIYVRFRHLGGLYIKFLQLLVVQSDFFKSLEKYDLFDIYDQAPYEDIDLNKIILARIKQSASLAIDSNPFAAGSFGQVYLGEYKGKRIVVKVLRPSVKKNLSFDLKIIGILSWVVDAILSDSAINARRTYVELAKTTRLETNYILEADYAAALYKKYKNHPSIVIPQTYREFSSDDFIVQDYIDGLVMTDVLRIKEKSVDTVGYVKDMIGSNLELQLTSLGVEVISGAFEDGGTYGDPHPGNILLLPNNKVGLIDFGLRAPAPKNTAGLYELVRQYSNIYNDSPDLSAYSKAVLDMYGGEVVQAMRSIEDYHGIKLHLVDAMMKNADLVVAQESGRVHALLSDYKFMRAFNSVINQNNRFCLKYELDGPELMRAGNLFIALCETLEVRKSVLGATYSEVVRRIGKNPMTHGRTLPHPDAAIETIASWVDRVAQHNPQLYRSIKHAQQFGGMYV